MIGSKKKELGFDFFLFFLFILCFFFSFSFSFSFSFFVSKNKGKKPRKEGQKQEEKNKNEDKEFRRESHSKDGDNCINIIFMTLGYVIIIELVDREEKRGGESINLINEVIFLVQQNSMEKTQSEGGKSEQKIKTNKNISQ